MSGLEADMLDSGTLTMSTKERNRLEILGRVLERRLMQAQAAEQLAGLERATTVVPEPGSAVLMGLGLAGLATRRKMHDN